MSRADIATYVQAANEGMTKKQAEATVDAVFNGLADEMKKTGRVQISGFGIFAVQDKPERPGRNPSTGEAMTIKAKRVAKFKPSKPLADKIDS